MPGYPLRNIPARTGDQFLLETMRVLQRLKLKPSPLWTGREVPYGHDDVLIFSSPSMDVEAGMRMTHYLRAALDRMGHANVTVIVCPAGMKVEHLPPEAMAAKGWVRAAKAGVVLGG